MENSRCRHGGWLYVTVPAKEAVFRLKLCVAGFDYRGPCTARLKLLEYGFPPMKTLILGLGNPLVSDDSVGLRVAEELKTRLAGRTDVEVSEDYWGGLRLMERMIGFDRAIVVDAIQTGAPPGTIHLLAPDDIPTQRSASAHDVNLSTALEFGRQAGARLPKNSHIRLVGIEAEDVLTFGQRLTPAVQAAVPRAVDAVLEALDGLLAGSA
jgi:hydrogenase maturation protease